MALTCNQALARLRHVYEKGRLAHAILICGPHGVGKKRLARELLQMIRQPSIEPANDLFGEATAPAPLPALDEFESAYVRILRPLSKSRRIKVESIRDLESTLHLSAPHGTWKAGVIVDADRLGTEATNAFLKTLEEPLPYTLLLLLSAMPEQLLPTVLSRCVKIELHESMAIALDQRASTLLQHCAELIAEGHFGEAVSALCLRAAFADCLAEIRAECKAQADAAYKEELKRYRDTTDGSWLKSREEFYSAQAEAKYLEERTRLLELLMLWFGDALRHAAGSQRLDFPQYAASTLCIARAEPMASLCRRIRALEALQHALSTNASEAITLDVGFLNAFGPSTLTVARTD